MARMLEIKALRPWPQDRRASAPRTWPP